MNDRLSADLERWERGELRADEVRSRHPHADADALLETHALVSLVASPLDEQPRLTWDELDERLDVAIDLEAEARAERVVPRRRVPLLKLAVAFVAGALVNPFNPATTTVEGVRAVARTTAQVVVEEVTEIFEPIGPPRSSGAVVVDSTRTRRLSAVTPEAAALPASDPVPRASEQSPSAPASPPPVRPRPGTTPQGDGRAVHEPPPSQGVPDETPPGPPETDDGPTDDGPTDDGTEEPATSPAEPSTPPGHERRPSTAPGPDRGAERTPGSDERRPATPAGHERRPAANSASKSDRSGPGPGAQAHSAPAKGGSPGKGPS